MKAQSDFSKAGEGSSGLSLWRLTNWARVLSGSSTHLARLSRMTWRKADSCLILSAISLGVCGPEAAGQALAGDNYEIDQGSSLVADGESIPGLFSNDELPPGFSVRQAEVVTEPEHGELVLNADGTFRYEPHPNFTGTDGFTYTAPISETVAVLSSRAPWTVPSTDDHRASIPQTLNRPGTPWTLRSQDRGFAAAV